MHVDKILAQIKDEHYLKWPRPLHSSSNVHDKKKYCCFHKNHGHYTEDCRDLNKQIKELIRKRKLQRFVKKGEHSGSRDNDKDKCEASPRDEDRTPQRSPSVIREIKTITGKAIHRRVIQIPQKVISEANEQHPQNAPNEIEMNGQGHIFL